jgi:hypothetical protein
MINFVAMSQKRFTVRVARVEGLSFFCQPPSLYGLLFVPAEDLAFLEPD